MFKAKLPNPNTSTLTSTPEIPCWGEACGGGEDRQSDHLTAHEQIQTNYEGYEQGLLFSSHLD